jgi:cell division protein FtsX
MATTVSMTMVFGFLAILNLALAATFGYAWYKYSADKVEAKFEQCFGTNAVDTKKYLKDVMIAGTIICSVLSLMFAYMAERAAHHKVVMPLN